MNDPWAQPPEVVARRLRGTMSTVRKLAVIAMVVMVLTVAACTSSNTVAPTSQNSLPSAVDLSATPAGWVPIDYGDAQVSVPPTWLAFDRQSDCATIPPGLLVIQPPEGRPWCGPGISVREPGAAAQAAEVNRHA